MAKAWVRWPWVGMGMACPLAMQRGGNGLHTGWGLELKAAKKNGVIKAWASPTCLPFQGSHLTSLSLSLLGQHKRDPRLGSRRWRYG